jgi:DNA-binding CsgD family transcriptional regulator
MVQPLEDAMDTHVSHHAIELPSPDLQAATLARPARDQPEAPLLAAVVEQLGLGVAVATFDGLVLHLNQAARRALRDSAFDVGDDGRLFSLRATDAGLLRSALAMATLERKSVIVAGDRRKGLTIAVQPLDFVVAGRPTRGVLLLFSLGARLNASAVGAYADAHQLTPAESAVVAGLCDGLQAKEVAQRTGSSIATVRSHLRSIYYKTGARNLQDLLARVASLPPLGLYGT